MDGERLCGIVLAAGAGTRFGGPKGLARTPDGEPWTGLAVRMLVAAGCDEVLVAVGAAADEVAALVPAPARAVRVADWDDGLSASVRAALACAAATAAHAAVLTPVDTPDAPPEAVRRLVAAASPGSAVGLDGALVRAVYGGRPGHPVLVGRAHWAALADGLAGDRGAGPYLAAHGATAVECGDLWAGTDVDRR